MAVEAPIIPYEKNNWRISWTLKTLHPSFENVTSELWKRYIRTLKTLYHNFEMLHPNCEKFYPNFENVISQLWNVTSELWKILSENFHSGIIPRLYQTLLNLVRWHFKTSCKFKVFLASSLSSLQDSRKVNVCLARFLQGQCLSCKILARRLARIIHCFARSCLSCKILARSMSFLQDSCKTPCKNNTLFR